MTSVTPESGGARRRRRRLAAEVKESLRELSVRLSLLNHQVGAHIELKDVDFDCLDLVARGNTAKLDPPIQTCTLPTSTAITIRSWTVATDGRQQASVMTGTDEHGGNFALGGGSLSRD